MSLFSHVLGSIACLLPSHLAFAVAFSVQNGTIDFSAKSNAGFAIHGTADLAKGRFKVIQNGDDLDSSPIAWMELCWYHVRWVRRKTMEAWIMPTPSSIASPVRIMQGKPKRCSTFQASSALSRGFVNRFRSRVLNLQNPHVIFNRQRISSEARP